MLSGISQHSFLILVYGSFVKSLKKIFRAKAVGLPFPPSSFFKLPVALFPKYLELFFISKYA